MNLKTRTRNDDAELTAIELLPLLIAVTVFFTRVRFSSLLTLAELGEARGVYAA
jgi:hypothetical protein